MKLFRMPLGPLGTNCYIINDESTNRCYLVDPGGNGKDVVRILEEKGLTLEGILLTHGHGDHIGGIQDIIDEIPVPVYIHRGDEAYLKDSKVNLSADMGLDVTVNGDIRFLKEGDVISWDHLSFKVLETPGHTPGGICFYGEGILLAGDTLFQGSVGRTDFPNGDFDALAKGIKEKLYVLPEDTIVYPGHGGETTIGYEKQYNPFVR